MRINEVIVEAINLTRYEDVVEHAVLTGIAAALGNLSYYKGRFSKEEEWTNKGSESELLGQLEPILQLSLPDNIADQLTLFVSREIIRDNSLSIYFSKLPEGTHAYVTGRREMTLSFSYIEELSQYILFDIWETAINDHSDNIVEGMFSIIKMAASRDKITTQQVFFDGTGNTGSVVNHLVSVFLHEMVHVIQDQAQLGRPDIEYRSYLDKTKDEFRNLSDRTRNSRFYDLYYASPQEMSAFSQQMALDAIRKFKLRNIKSEEDIPRITSEDILNFIKEVIGNRFGDPRNQKEYAVFKRYAKIVYQEVQKYLDEKRKTFKPSEK
jgi:hypothetical protein